MSSPLFQDYVWIEGVPKGISPALSPSGYKVIGDPYKKRFTVEKYEADRFFAQIYDSNLFDFRTLRKDDLSSWQRELVSEDGQDKHTLLRHLIRNIDERIVLIEEAYFQNNICLECRFLSPQMVLIGTQKIFFKERGDPFDGVILTDPLGKRVMQKSYAVDLETKEFTTLLKEEW